MIRVVRPSATSALPTKARTALGRRQAAASGFKAGDPGIQTAWTNFLRSRPKAEVATALDACFRRKCAYCEAVAAQDIEHFYPKTSHPDRMFRWDNFLRGCKNCNNSKRDEFPMDPVSAPLLLDPCQDEPLDYFVWDYLTGATGVRPEAPFEQRGRATRDLLRLDLEPLREERKLKWLTVLYLLSQVATQDPVTSETREILRETLDQRRPWLGIVRQLFRRPSAQHARLLAMARAKIPEIDQWVASWL